MIKKTMRSALAKVSLATLAACVSMAATATDYSPNFKGTDINEFINIVGKNLQRTIIINPNVRGKINVRSYEMLTEEQYYYFFLNVLEVYGFAIVEMDNGILKVVRNKDSKGLAIPVVGNKSPGIGDEMVTRVVEVKNVPVRDLASLLRQFSNQAGGGHVVNYDPANVIMMTGPAATLSRLYKIIQLVDHAGDQEVEIFKLKYATAGELVRIVSSMYKGKGGKPDQPSFLIPKVIADERTNSILVSGEPLARRKVLTLIGRLDSDLEENGNTRVFNIKYAKAEDLVKVLKGVSESLVAAETKGQKTSRGSRGNAGRDININFHGDSNALVITAQPDMMRSLADVISKLDIRRAQVLVEAIIVEVFEGDGVNLGVQWISKDGGFTQFTNGGPTVGQVAAGVYAAKDVEGKTTTRITDSGVSVTDVEPSVRGDVTLLAQALGSVNGMMIGVLKDDWGAIVNALSTDTNSNVLSTPSITTLDNQEASFLVGQSVPTITGTSTGSNNSNPFQTVSREEVGIKLKVTPQINEGSAIQLTIEQEVSSVSGTTAVDITINKRELNTTVMADDGGVVVLGGLIDENVQESVSKVPILGDIPFIGHLFKSTSTTKQKRNLMVFIRATIVRNEATMSQLSHRKYNYIRAQQLKRQADGVTLMPQTDVPTLPGWDDALALPPTFEDYHLNKDKQKNDE
ncbi:MAG: general secretion pathway protein D [Alteromonadaceae bacterium]|jgi:general secretion pathway protein D